MPVTRSRSHWSRPGASLVELLIVLAIAALLASLLLVAVQYSRAAARRTVCQNNLRQLSFAMRSYTETRKQYPDVSPADEAGGWVVALLPFLHEQALKNKVTAATGLVNRTSENCPPPLDAPTDFAHHRAHGIRTR